MRKIANVITYEDSTLVVSLQRTEAGYEPFLVLEQHEHGHDRECTATFVELPLSCIAALIDAMNDVKIRAAATGPAPPPLVSDRGAAAGVITLTDPT